MPRVPTMDPARGTDTRALPPRYDRANTRGTHGEAIAEGLGQLGRGVTSALGVVADERQRAVRALSDRQEAALGEEILDTVDDGDHGFLRLQGEDALGAEGPALEKLEKRRQTLVAQLTDGAARERFDARSKEMVLVTRRRMESHVTRQRKVAATANAEASASSALAALARAYSEPDDVREAIIRQPLESIEGLAVSAEDRKARRDAWLQKAHTVVLQEYRVKDDPEGAKKYLDKYRDQLGQGATEARKWIESELGEKSVRSQARNIYLAAIQKGSQWVDEVQATQDALKTGDEEVFRKTKVLVAQNLATQRAAAKEQLTTLRGLYNGGQGSIDTPEGRAARDYLRDPRNGHTEMWDTFSRRMQADERARSPTGSEARRVQRESDRLAMARFRAMDLADQAEHDVETSEVFADASEITRLEAVAVQKRARTAVDKVGRLTLGNFSSVVGKTASGAFGKNKGATDEFKARMTEWYLQRIADGDKPPTAQEVDAKLKDSLLYDSRGILKSGKYRFQVPEGEAFNPDAPAEQPYQRNRAPAAPPPPAKAPAPKAGDLVHVKLKNGQKGRVPRAKFDPNTMTEIP